MESKKYYLGFVPKRLKIKDRPELSNFPFNVVFVKFIDKNRQLISATAIYNPNFASFRENEEEQKMNYKNKFGGDFWLEISFNKKTGMYWGTKYCGNEKKWTSFGPGWKGFFFHFTMSGLSNGEKCLFKNQRE